MSELLDSRVNSRSSKQLRQRRVSEADHPVGASWQHLSPAPVKDSAQEDSWHEPCEDQDQEWEPGAGLDGCTLRMGYGGRCSW